MFTQRYNARSLKVGDTAYVGRRHSNYEGKVTKVTPSGQIVVEMSGGNRPTPFSLRFNSYGEEIGTDASYRSYLISEDDYNEREHRKARQQTLFSVRTELNRLTSLADRDELLEALDELRAKVAAEL